jgi:hypothetical protein
MGVQAVRTRIARKVSGTAAAVEFFYNPMWRAYGHQQHPEAGAATHYWLRSWAHELGWFMLDQVVLRPGEAFRFPENQLRIITQVGALSLLNADGLPDAHCVRSSTDCLSLESVIQGGLNVKQPLAKFRGPGPTTRND